MHHNKLMPLDTARLASELAASHLFDPDWYTGKYPGSELIGLSPLDSYLQIGRFLGRHPSPKFDADFFRSSYGDIPEAYPEIDFYFATNDGRPTNEDDARAIVDQDARSAGFTLPDFTKKISFCTPILNRFDDIRVTLRSNIEENRPFENDIEFIVLCFDDDDTVKNWIETEFAPELASGYLRFLSSNALDVWHFPRAKNAFKGHLNGRLHSSLDGDNFVSWRETSIILELLDKFGESFVFHSFTGNHGDGTCGRVTTSTSAFHAVGYDDTLLTQQYDDIDAIVSILGKYPWMKFFHTSENSDVFSEKMNVILSEAALFKNNKQFLRLSDRKLPINPKGPRGVWDLRDMRVRNHINSIYSWSKRIPGRLFDKYSREKLAINYDCLIQSLPKEDLFAESFSTRRIPIADQLPKGGITAILCVRNQPNLLKRNIDHHRNIGVSNFLIIDDHSSEPIQGADFGENVFVFVPRSGSFKTAKQLWMETLARRFVPDGDWVLVLDADEFLELPPEHSTIQSLVTKLPARRDFIGAILIDVFPKLAASKAREGISERAAPETLFYYNPSSVPERYKNIGTIQWGFGNKPELSWALDVRYAAFGTTDCLRKIPLFRLGPDTHFHSGQHSLRNRKSENRFTDNWIDEFTLAIRHERLILNLGETREDGNLHTSKLRYQEIENREVIRSEGIARISKIQHSFPYSAEKVYDCIREVLGQSSA